MRRANFRLLAVALVMLTAGLMVTAAAQAWKRGQEGDPHNLGPAYNDRAAKVCRDGLRIQVASSEQGPYDLLVTSGTLVVASREVTLQRRSVRTPPYGTRAFSGTFTLSFSPRLAARTTVEIGFRGFDPFTATVRNCRLGDDDDDD